MTTTLQDAERILRDAEQSTGLADWGGAGYFEESFRMLFGAMVNSLINEAQLHARGQRGAALRLQAMAEARLQFIDDRRKWPAIVEERIVKPLIITGLPRSGSTFLNALLAQDTANRTLLTWEMMFPSPPPERDTYERDPRIDRTQGIVDAMGWGDPYLNTLHPFGARLSEECQLLMELMCLGENLPATWRLPSYNKARRNVDMRQGYLTHRMALQNLQHRYKGERWVIKYPGHLFHLEHLLAVYPDAQVVQTHRDPAKIVPSVAALLVAFRRVNSDAPIDGNRIAQANLSGFAHGLESAIEFRRRPGVEQHFHDVHFRALIADPMATVRTIYDRFGLELRDDAVARMKAWLATDDSHSAKAKFTLEQFGLDEAQIDGAFDGYIGHYGIVRERAPRTPAARDDA